MTRAAATDADNKLPLVPAAALHKCISFIVSGCGSSPEEVKVVTDHLVGCNEMGHDSHGVTMLPNYIKKFLAGGLVPNSRPTLAKRTATVSVWDAGLGFGQVNGRVAMLDSIAHMKKDPDAGVHLVLLKTSNHVGRLGAYADLAVEAGLVSVMCANVLGPRVAPFGGRDARLGTNPICIAAPADPHPLILDMATSVLAMGKVKVAHQKGITVPDGVLLDGEGEPTTDPSAIFRGGCGLPLGSPIVGYKGFGLALMCDVLAGALCQGGTVGSSVLEMRKSGREEGPSSGGANCIFALLINPGGCGGDSMKSEIATLVDYVLESPAAADGPVQMPGDPERATRKHRLEHGIPLDAETAKQLVAAGEAVGVSGSDLEFMRSTLVG